MKYLKKFEQVDLEEPKVKRYNDYIDLPPITTDDSDGGDDNNNYNAYVQEWLNYWNDKEFPPMFSEIWRDEKYRKGLDNYKDTNAFIFYSKLWYEHKFDYPQTKDVIEDEITKFIDNYNKSVYDLDRQREISKEVDEIINTHEVDLGGKKVTYKLETPQKGHVNRFIRGGESEEYANMKLFSLLSIEDIYDPNNTPSGEEWKEWVKNTYKPFIEEYIEPFVKENGWRIWSI